MSVNAGLANPINTNKNNIKMVLFFDHCRYNDNCNNIIDNKKTPNIPLVKNI